MNDLTNELTVLLVQQEVTKLYQKIESRGNTIKTLQKEMATFENLIDDLNSKLDSVITN